MLDPGGTSFQPFLTGLAIRIYAVEQLIAYSGQFALIDVLGEVCVVLFCLGSGLFARTVTVQAYNQRAVGTLDPDVFYWLLGVFLDDHRDRVEIIFQRRISARSIVQITIMLGPGYAACAVDAIGHQMALRWILNPS